MGLALTRRLSFTGDFKMSIKKRVCILLKFICFVLVTLTLVYIVNNLLKPKYYYNEAWPTTNTYADFYNLKKNTVDVLMLGSSHAVSSLNPQVLYDEYGITSYNIGCEQQSPLLTYYWLKEALKYQTPKVVIIDTYTFHKYVDAYVYNGMNCNETAVRKSMDGMRFSPLKIEAAKNIERYDESQNALSFFLLNLRYHTRWTRLTENDYTKTQMVDHGGVKGFSVSGGIDKSSQYTPFRADEADDIVPEEMVDVAKEYIGKTIELCNEKGIQLIFVNIPYAESIARYKSTKEYSDLYEIPFYDFNEEYLYNEIAYDPVENLLGHPNYLGAEKITSFLGNVLSEQYNIKKREDSSFDVSRQIYEHKVENIKLTQTVDVHQYLDLIDNDKYSIFILAPESYSAYLSDDIMEKLFSLGFTTELRGVEDGTHYFAVKDGSSVYEELTKDDILTKSSIRNRMVLYKCEINKQTVHENGYVYSLNIGGTECGDRHAGINIVIYDNDLKCVVDKINVDTSTEEVALNHY